MKFFMEPWWKFEFSFLRIVFFAELEYSKSDVIWG